MTAGSEIEKGSASSLIESVSASPSRASRARRVGSARAANVRSRSGGEKLTMRLSVCRHEHAVKHDVRLTCRGEVSCRARLAQVQESRGRVRDKTEAANPDGPGG